MVDIKRFKNLMCFPWYNPRAVTCSSNKDFSSKSRAVIDLYNNQTSLCYYRDVFHSASFGIMESAPGFYELDKFNDFNPNSYLSIFVIILMRVLMSINRLFKNKHVYLFLVGEFNGTIWRLWIIRWDQALINKDYSSPHIKRFPWQFSINDRPAFQEVTQEPKSSRRRGKISTFHEFRRNKR